MVKEPYLGIWIKNHLDQIEEDYIQHMSTLYRKEMKKSKRVVSSYHQFCKIIYVLESLGLIKKTKEEEASKNWLKPRKYFSLVKSKKNSIEWSNPQKYYTVK